MPTDVQPHKLAAKDVESMTGTCVVCGPVDLEKRTGGGYAWYACSEARKASHRRRLSEHNRRTSEYRQRHLDDVRYVASALLSSAKQRVKKTGFEVTASVDDVLEVLHDSCPICGVDMQHGRGHKDNSFSLDRIDSTKGYVPGNLAVICFRCNRIKSDGTPDDHRRIADWMEKNAH